MPVQNLLMPTETRFQTSKDGNFNHSKDGNFNLSKDGNFNLSKQRAACDAQPVKPSSSIIILTYGFRKVSNNVFYQQFQKRVARFNIG